MTWARATSTALLVLGVAGAAGSCGGAPTAARTAGPAPASAHGGTAHRPGSNITRADYAGSAACAPCHAEIYKTQSRSAMHEMTRDGRTAKSRAPWNGGTFSFKGERANLSTQNGERFVSLETRAGKKLFRVTRVIGGKNREDYAGVPVASTVGPFAENDEEWILPVSWVFATSSFRYKGYSVMVKERPGMSEGPRWNETCIFCHNTPPALSSLLGVLSPGHRGYQGEIVDELLPMGRRAQYQVKEPGTLLTALNDELRVLGSKPAPNAPDAALRYAIEETRKHFRGKHLVEVGIGCETCHYGAIAHAETPTVLPSLWPQLPGLSVQLPADEKRERVSAINRGCARCHQVLFSGYEWTWEGGKRRANAGGSHINSGEGRDFLLGGCKTEMSCTQCHDPHAESANAKAAEHPEAINALCIQCHQRYATETAVRAHTHHDPKGAGAQCIECHMPRKNMALDGSLSRYHRIGSPSDPERVLLDRPLECALCHQGFSVRKITDTMETWWNKKYDREALTLAYGSLDAPALWATAKLGKPHEQAIAYYLLGKAGDKKTAAAIAPGLWSERPLVRGYAVSALSALAGTRCTVDTDAPVQDIQLEAAAWLSAHGL